MKNKYLRQLSGCKCADNHLTSCVPDRRETKRQKMAHFRSVSNHMVLKLQQGSFYLEFCKVFKLSFCRAQEWGIFITWAQRVLSWLPQIIIIDKLKIKFMGNNNSYNLLSCTNIFDHMTSYFILADVARISSKGWGWETRVETKKRRPIAWAPGRAQGQRPGGSKGQGPRSSGSFTKLWALKWCILASNLRSLVSLHSSWIWASQPCNL